MTTKENIEKVLWDACISFRNKIDSSIYKDYILSMLFVKYLSDTYNEKLKEYNEKFGEGSDRAQRMMKRERFVLDETSTFEHLYSKRNDDEIGQITVSYTHLTLP